MLGQGHQYGTWPVGTPSGTQLAFQYWFKDVPGTAHVWVASNGLWATSP